MALIASTASFSGRLGRDNPRGQVAQAQDGQECFSKRFHLGFWAFQESSREDPKRAPWGPMGAPRGPR
eukprot:3985379-Pyramimonas_sp.AAC.1